MNVFHHLTFQQGKGRKKSKAERQAKASSKPRKTIRDWMKISRYEYVIDGKTYNVMLGASVMCRMTGWNNPKRLKALWDRTSTQMRQATVTHTGIITFTRSTYKEYSTGRAYRARVEIMLAKTDLVRKPCNDTTRTVPHRSRSHSSYQWKT